MDSCAGERGGGGTTALTAEQASAAARAHFAAALSILTGVSSAAEEGADAATGGGGGGGGNSRAAAPTARVTRGPSLLAPPPLFPTSPFDGPTGDGGRDAEADLGLEDMSAVSSPPGTSHDVAAAPAAVASANVGARRHLGGVRAAGAPPHPCPPPPTTAELTDWAAAAAAGTVTVSAAPSAAATAALMGLRNSHVVPLLGVAPGCAPDSPDVLLTAVPAGGIRLSAALERAAADAAGGAWPSPPPPVVARWAAGLASAVAAASLAGLIVTVHPATVWLVPHEGVGGPSPGAPPHACAADLWVSEPEMVDTLLDCSAGAPPLDELAPYLAPEAFARHRAGAAPTVDEGAGGREGAPGMTARTKAVLGSEAACVYAIGMLVWHWIAGCEPWAGLPAADIYLRGTVRGDPPPGDPCRHADAPPELTEVMAACTARRPPRRLRAAAAAAAFLAAARRLGGDGDPLAERRRPIVLSLAPRAVADDGARARAAAAAAPPRPRPPAADGQRGAADAAGEPPTPPRVVPATAARFEALTAALRPPAAPPAVDAGAGAAPEGAVQRRLAALEAATAAAAADAAAVPPMRSPAAGRDDSRWAPRRFGRPPAAGGSALAVAAPPPSPLALVDDDEAATAAAVAGCGGSHADLEAESPMPPPPTPADAAYRAVDCVRTGLAGTPTDQLWGACRPAVGGGGDGTPAYRRPQSVASAASDAATCFSCGTEERLGGVPPEDTTDTEDDDASDVDDADASAVRVDDGGVIAERSAPLFSDGSDTDDSAESATTSEAAGDESNAASACIDAPGGGSEEDEEVSEEAQETDEEDEEAVLLRRLAEIRARKRASAGLDASAGVGAPVDISLANPPPRTPTRPYSGPLAAPALASWASSPPLPRQPVTDLSLPSSPAIAAIASTVGTSRRSSAAAAPPPLAVEAASVAPVVTVVSSGPEALLSSGSAADMMLSNDSWASGGAFDDADFEEQAVGSRVTAAADDSLAAGVIGGGRPRRAVFVASGSASPGGGGRSAVSDLHGGSERMAASLATAVTSGALGDGSRGRGPVPRDGSAPALGGGSARRPGSAPAGVDDPLLPRYQDMSTEELGARAAAAAVRMEKVASEASLPAAASRAGGAGGGGGGGGGGPRAAVGALAHGSLDDLRRARESGSGRRASDEMLSKDAMLSSAAPDSASDAAAAAAAARRGRSGRAAAADGGPGLPRPQSTGGNGRGAALVRERKARAAHALRALNRPPHCDDVETVATAAAVLQKLTAPRSANGGHAKGGAADADAAVRGYVVDAAGVETLLSTLARFHAASKRVRGSVGSARSLDGDAPGGGLVRIDSDLGGGGGGGGLARVDSTLSRVGDDDASLAAITAAAPPDDVASLLCFVLLALGNLVAWDVRAYAVFMGSTGEGVRTVTRVMIHWQNHPGVQERGCYALACASLGFPVRAKEAFGRSVDVAVRALALATRSTGGGVSKPGACAKQAAAALVGMVAGCAPNAVRAGKRGGAKRLVAAFDALRRSATALRKHGEGLLMTRALLALLEAPENVVPAAAAGASAMLLRAAETWCLPVTLLVTASAGGGGGGRNGGPPSTGSSGSTSGNGGTGGTAAGPNADLAVKIVAALTALTFSAASAQDVLEGAAARVLPALMRAHAGDGAVTAGCLSLTRALLAHARRVAVFPCVRNGIVEALVVALSTHGLGLSGGAGDGAPGSARASSASGHSVDSSGAAAALAVSSAAAAAAAAAGAASPLDVAAAIAADACRALTALCAEAPTAAGRGDGSDAGPATTAERALLAARLRSSHAEAAAKAARAAHRRNATVPAAAAAREAGAAMAALRKSVGAAAAGRRGLPRLRSART
ncbi:hypothetical protein BU14_0027s0099 [Porphyra umbilicalis]|uniref:Protein kinase domain-containing protein n=1 Tax=Porphyra umbilicalis TaxID=2786 RepID=A0A1X6PK73_PORUM|nr:hypothetical protein BU14_0027s0099 [Porphyra umbilicalis]|eukprot:OSX81073.1 hypothetical protein BU14_0027s0099 [Porphyra umbilicalis]